MVIMIDTLVCARLRARQPVLSVANAAAGSSIHAYACTRMHFMAYASLP
jgi:hypothetical protein